VWRQRPRSPLGDRDDPVLVWDGGDVLEIGGTVRGIAQADGAAFDPVTSTWRRIATAPASIGTAGEAVVWTGRQVILFGGQAAGSKDAISCCVAGLYDAARNVWSTSAPAPTGELTQVTAVWTGTRVLVAGVGHGGLVVAATYDPADDRWTRLDPPRAAGHPAIGVALATAGNRVVLWSMWGRWQQTGPSEYTGYSGIDVYRVTGGGTWQPVASVWPQHESVLVPVTAGAQVLIPPTDTWCGACSHPPRIGAHGYLLDPISMRLTTIPHGPLDDARPQIVWTGAAAVAVATSLISGPGVGIRPGDVAFWNPASAAWANGPRLPHRTARTAWTAAWLTDRLLLLAVTGDVLTLGP
jgi:hypothetical protein